MKTNILCPHLPPKFLELGQCLISKFLYLDSPKKRICSRIFSFQITHWIYPQALNLFLHSHSSCSFKYTCKETFGWKFMHLFYIKPDHLSIGILKIELDFLNTYAYEAIINKYKKISAASYIKCVHKYWNFKWQDNSNWACLTSSGTWTCRTNINCSIELSGMIFWVQLLSVVCNFEFWRENEQINDWNNKIAMYYYRERKTNYECSILEVVVDKKDKT